MDLESNATLGAFVAINYIRCKEEYLSRFEELFKSRAGAIDRLKGFLRMEVLKPQPNGKETSDKETEPEPYLVVSHWESKDCFQDWLKSPEFHEGHRRAFEDMNRAKEQGQEAPMHSKFVVYDVLTR